MEFWSACVHYMGGEKVAYKGKICTAYEGVGIEPEAPEDLNLYDYDEISKVIDKQLNLMKGDRMAELLKINGAKNVNIRKVDLTIDLTYINGELQDQDKTFSVADIALLSEPEMQDEPKDANVEETTEENYLG